MNKKRNIIILLCFLSFVVVGIVSYLDLQKSIQKTDEEQYIILTDCIYGAVDSALSKPIVAAMSMSNDKFISDLLINETKYKDNEFEKIVVDYLNMYKESIGAQTAFLISDSSKKYYTGDGFNKIVDPENDDHDVWYSIFVNSRRKYDLDIDVDQVNNDCWTVFVNTRIVDENGKLLGICGLGISMDNLQKVLANYENNYDIKVNFVNSDGLVQLDTDTVNIEVSYLYDVQYGKEKDGYSYRNEDGKYVVMKYVDSLNWYLVIHGDEHRISIKDLKSIGICCIILVLVNAFAICMVLNIKEDEN